MEVLLQALPIKKNLKYMSEQKGHPRGLYLLFITEMWERFSYYGMRALFMLYMVKALQLEDKEASGIYGSYTGLVYLTPLLGGYIADRYWGNRRSIVVGGLVMALGQFFMFFSAMNYTEPYAKFLMFIGLGALILGNGFFKPNISTMVGDLYAPNDSRKDTAFTIFYMGINLGATIAPFWCGFVGDTDNPGDFKWGLLSAAIGMLIGIGIFQTLKNRFLRTPDGIPIGLAPAKAPVPQATSGEQKPEFTAPVINKASRLFFSLAGVLVLFLLFSINYSSFTNPQISLFHDADWIGAAIYSVCIIMPVFIATEPSLTKLERSRIYVVYIVAFFVIFFWAAFEQAGASLTLFADRQTDRNIFNIEIPASFFQSVNAIFVVTMAPLFAMLWTFLRKRKIEPSSPMKQAIGLLLLSFGYLVIALGVKGVDSSTKVSMLWLISLYGIHTMGELCLSPIGLSLVNKLAPARFASLLMGVWFMSTAAANKFAGLLSSYYPGQEDGTMVTKHFLGYQIANLYDFFMLFVVMSGVAAVLLLLLTKKLVKMMEGIR